MQSGPIVDLKQTSHEKPTGTTIRQPVVLRRRRRENRLRTRLITERAHRARAAAGKRLRDPANADDLVSPSRDRPGDPNSVPHPPSTLALGPAFHHDEAREKNIVLQVDVLDQILSELVNSHVERLP